MVRLDFTYLVVAVGAGLAERAAQALADALPRHLDQAERRDVRDRGLCLFAGERFLQRRVDLAPVVLALPVDEVEDSAAADIPEPERNPFDTRRRSAIV